MALTRHAGGEETRMVPGGKVMAAIRKDAGRRLKGKKEKSTPSLQKKTREKGKRRSNTKKRKVRLSRCGLGSKKGFGSEGRKSHARGGDQKGRDSLGKRARSPLP